LLQPIADGVKALVKPMTLPYHADWAIFRLAPMLGIILTGSLWFFVAIYFPVARPALNVFLIFTVSALAVYSVIFTAWAGNSFYSVLGGIRASAQMLSYDVVFSIILVPVLYLVTTTDMYEVQTMASGTKVYLKLLPLVIIFFITILAEANRTPFDLPEAEAELVAGYHVEHSGFLFALFFLSEYNSMLVVAALFTILLT
jgi:NADH-quinone oxidoreductase subunit H